MHPQTETASGLEPVLILEPLRLPGCNLLEARKLEADGISHIRRALWHDVDSLTPAASALSGGFAFTSATITKIIRAELAKLEHEESIRILYACESGSRAWGFASRDSDYDVRFIYLHPLEWYLSLEQKRDVLERLLPHDIDLAGWDLRKALGLFAKSNPPMLEWLGSPTVYQEEKVFLADLKALLPSYYAPRACMYHYLHMAKGNFREYLKGETVWTKKYLYVLRPILACRWIEAGYGPVPMEMHTLVDRLLPEGESKTAIHELIARKRQGEELDKGPRIPALDTLIEEALEQLEDAPKPPEQPRMTMTALDRLFRDVLRRNAPRSDTAPPDLFW